MKRCFVSFLCCLFMLAGCGEPPEPTAPEIAPADIAAAVVQSQPDPEGLVELPLEVEVDFLASFDLNEYRWGSVWTGSGMDAREVIVLQVRDELGVEQAALHLEEHRQSRIVDFFGYAPEQVELLENAKILTHGVHVAFLVCEDMEMAQKAFSACFEEGETAQLDVGELKEEKVNPGLDISGFDPFDPPNDVDMTLYDNTAVVQAWRSGDENGLSEMDKTILSVCKAVFAEVITEGMTDFEKELALHDWLIAHGVYDPKSRDNVAHIGQPNNTDPYGMLRGGYGICLGFATTFQLFMDLAEIECITVVGAAYDSEQDHAWNMVKLDGEWYCVDVTWNNSGDRQPDREYAIHRYFNVTSAHLRSTDHQWDYENIPEATATRYCWKSAHNLTDQPPV